MSVRPEERRTAREYNRLARQNSVRGTLARLLGDLPTYLFNTPALIVPGEFGLGPNHRVLELGSGRAGLAKLLARRAGLRYPPVALDISTEVLRQAAADFGGVPAVQLVAGAVRARRRARAHHGEHLQGRFLLARLRGAQSERSRPSAGRWRLRPL